VIDPVPDAVPEEGVAPDMDQVYVIGSAPDNLTGNPGSIAAEQKPGSLFFVTSGWQLMSGFDKTVTVNEQIAV